MQIEPIVKCHKDWIDSPRAYDAMTVKISVREFTTGTANEMGSVARR